MKYLTDQAVETIREALRTGARHAETNCCEKDVIEIDEALDLLDAEPPQADASAEELALLVEIAHDPTGAELIAADRLAVLEGAAERAVGWLNDDGAPPTEDGLRDAILGK